MMYAGDNLKNAVATGNKASELLSKMGEIKTLEKTLKKAESKYSRLGEFEKKLPENKEIAGNYDSAKWSHDYALEKAKNLSREVVEAVITCEYAGKKIETLKVEEAAKNLETHIKYPKRKEYEIEIEGAEISFKYDLNNPGSYLALGNMLGGLTAPQKPNWTYVAFSFAYIFIAPVIHVALRSILKTAENAEKVVAVRHYEKAKEIVNLTLNG